MINFPKRNVAQPVIQPSKNTEVVVSHQQLPESQKQVKHSCPGAIWNDKLYPSELWQMHDDLDKLAYRKLSQKEADEIRERICVSLSQAELIADDKLFKFVQDSINSVGIDQYSNMLKQAMTSDSQILLALRCYAAATSEFRARDTIEIYSNKSMNSIEFFPSSCQVDSTCLIDRPESDDDDPYWRSKNHSSSKHRKIRSIMTDPEPTERDKMPSSIAGQMSNILSGFGINVQTNRDAWDVLSVKSKTSSVEDRIISRIAYLIMNANVRKNIIANHKLAGPA